MLRESVNPWSWSEALGFDQAQIVSGQSRVLLASGQDAVDADGNPSHPGDMPRQLELALHNVEAVLHDADMSIANVVRMNVYSTDVDLLFASWGELQGRFAASGTRFVTSVIGVSRLAAPDLMVLLEVTAVH